LKFLDSADVVCAGSIVGIKRKSARTADVPALLTGRQSTDRSVGCVLVLIPRDDAVLR
jgi:hypothetical protein